MDSEKLIEQLNDFNENHIAVLCGSGQCACGYLCDKDDCIVVRAATALSTLQAENEKLRAELERVKRCIEIIEKQRDSAIEELENYMVQDVLDGNEPCGICAKASDTPCECCDPKWRGPKKED